MKTQINIPFLLLCVLAANLVSGQRQAKIDSLNRILETEIAERRRVDIYNEIARQYRSQDSARTAFFVNKAIQLSNEIDYPKGISDAYYCIGWSTMVKGNYTIAIELLKKALTIAQASSYKKGEAIAFNGLGVVHFYKGDYSSALEQYFKSLAIRKELGGQKGIASSYNNIGLIYYYQGNYPFALDYHLKSLRIMEEIGDEKGISDSYSNIGKIYEEQGDYTLTLEYYHKSLKIREALKDKIHMGFSYSSLGGVYEKQGNHTSALAYHQKSLKIMEELGDKNGIANSYNDMGAVFLEQKKYRTALKYYRLSLDLYNEIGSKADATSSLLGLGKVHFAQNQYGEAIRYFEEATESAQELGQKDKVRDGAEQLALAYASIGRYQDAFNSMRLFKSMADSLNNEETAKIITSHTMQHKFDRKEALLKAKQEKKELEQQQQLQAQKYYTYVSVGVVLGLLAIALIIYQGKQKQKKANELLEQQKEEIAVQAEELVNANRRLQELDKIKNRFFANISHELRTPLTLILGNIDKIKNKTTDFSKELSSTRKHASLLHQLINQLLDITKLEEGKMELNLTVQPLLGCLKSYLQSFEALALEKNIKLEFKSNQEECYAMIDRQAYEKIVFNLLSNAYKFTSDHGSIKLEANIHDDELQLTISDTGIGIPEEKLPLIFDRFYQVEASMNRNYEGTGIGLSLVKELVELHDGNIQVSSILGEGTAFQLNMPIQIIDVPINYEEQRELGVGISKGIYEMKMQSETSKLKQTQELDKPIVLIVEDHSDLQTLIAEDLMDDYRILKASNGQEGLEKAFEEIPDLIISDVMMPHKNGYELCQVLKTDERSSHIPIILLTARTAKEDKLQGLEVGADDYLSKPFDSEELNIRVKNLIKNRALLQEKFSQQESLSASLAKDIAQNSTEKLFLDKLLASFEEHYADEQYDVKQMAKAINMSTRQLHRKLKALSDQSPNKMLQNYRLERAKALLQDKNLQVKEVGFNVGFSSQSYFNKCFKDKFGMTPRAFQQSA